MEIIQEIGSYAGLAAVVGLAVLSALYFSQARDVKRLREWAGRAPERTEAPLPGRVVAQPVPKPPVPKPPAAPAKPAQPAKPGVPAPASAAAAAAAGAAPAVATGPAAATPAGAGATAETKEAGESQNGTDEQAALSQDTVVHPPPAPPEDDEEEKDEDGAPGEGDDGDEDEERPGEAEADSEDEDDDAEPAPEDFHEEFDPDEDVDDTGDRPAVAPPRPPPPPRPTIPIGGASRPDRTGILPPYEQSRPGGPVSGGGGGGGLFASPRRAVAVVGGSLLALLVIGFGVLQLTGGDDESPNPAPNGSPRDEGEQTSPDSRARPRINPRNVRVAVLNGTTVPGLAAQIGDSIERQGFQLGTVTNFIDQQRAESVVKYAPGAEREAAEVGRRLKISQREPVDAESQGLAGDATVVVVAGADKTQ